jgi:hypothetical protein
MRHGRHEKTRMGIAAVGAGKRTVGAGRLRAGDRGAQRPRAAALAGARARAARALLAVVAARPLALVVRRRQAWRRAQGGGGPGVQLGVHVGLGVELRHVSSGILRGVGRRDARERARGGVSGSRAVAPYVGWWIPAAPRPRPAPYPHLALPSPSLLSRFSRDSWRYPTNCVNYAEHRQPGSVWTRRRRFACMATGLL